MSTNLNPIKTEWKETNYGTQNWKCNRKDDQEDCEIKSEELQTGLKKLKNGNVWRQKNVKQGYLNFQMKFMYQGQDQQNGLVR